MRLLRLHARARTPAGYKTTNFPKPRKLSPSRSFRTPLQLNSTPVPGCSIQRVGGPLGLSLLSPSCCGRLGNLNTGLGSVALPRLRECYVHLQAEGVSNSSNRISKTAYMRTVIWLSPAQMPDTYPRVARHATDMNHKHRPRPVLTHTTTRLAHHDICSISIWHVHRVCLLLALRNPPGLNV